MKKLNRHIYQFILMVVSFLLLQQESEAQEDSVTAVPVVKLHYFNNNNSLQYLVLESMQKKGKTLTPQPNKIYELYLNSSQPDMLIAKLQTGENGKAKAFLPPSLKAAWDAAPQHVFVVKEGDEEVITDFSIIKTKTTLDTASADGLRNITATVMKLENDEWMPAADVELKIGIQRQGGILSAGEEETYTTDSSGMVTVELNKANLPGDQTGDLVLVAKAENNDEFGNLLVEKKVPWGTVVKADKNFFDQRTLWTTRFRTPFWLLFIAYSIVIGVWGTLIFLIVQLVKIRRLGIQHTAKE